MKVHQAFQTVLVAPLVGVVSYLWLIGQFETMGDAGIGSVVGFVIICWIVAMAITLVIGFPVGFGLSAVLRRWHQESLVAYLTLGPGLALILAIILGDPEMGVGFAATATILALGYWFFVAKPRVENDVWRGNG